MTFPYLKQQSVLRHPVSYQVIDPGKDLVIILNLKLMKLEDSKFFFPKDFSRLINFESFRFY